MGHKISLIGSNRVSAEEGEENVTYPNAAHCARVNLRRGWRRKNGVLLQSSRSLESAMKCPFYDSNLEIISETHI